MGRGDKRSKKGKIWRGSYGNSRPKTKSYVPGDAKPKPAEPTTPAEE